MGLDVVLVPLGWDRLETGTTISGSPRYEWQELNDILRQAQNYGLRVILRVYNAPVWHTPFDAPLTSPPTDPQVMRNFMRAMVQYVNSNSNGNRVAGYVIWNEPNIPEQWGNRPANASEYMNLLQAAYQGAKSADDNTVIVSASLAPTETSFNGSINDLDYLDQLYNLGLADTVDFVGMSGLGYDHDPDFDPGIVDYSFTRLRYLRDIMVVNGHVDGKAWALEVGWLRDSRFDMGPFEPFKVSAAQQIQYITRAQEKADEEWIWLDTIIIWNLGFNRYYQPTSNFYWYSLEFPQ